MPDLDALDHPVRRRSARLCRIFGRYMRRFMARNFHAVRLARGTCPDLPHDRAVVVYTNHPSWWDPAFFMVLAMARFPGRRCFGPMEEQALRQYRFMSRLGIFGIETGTRRGAATFLRISERILELPDGMLWVTAQGRFTDPRTRPVRLQPGVAHLLARTPGVLAVPLALEYPFWNERYPEALARFGEVVEERSSRADDWQVLLEARLEATMAALAEDARSRDPARFEDVATGSVGIGGVYDLWRRGRAAIRGERFEPGHEREAP